MGILITQKAIPMIFSCSHRLFSAIAQWYEKQRLGKARLAP